MSSPLRGLPPAPLSETARPGLAEGLLRRVTPGIGAPEPDQLPTLVRSNNLLGLLRDESLDEYELLVPMLKTVELERREVLVEPGAPIQAVFFPIGCVASLIKILANGKRIEVGTAGIEGMSGLPVFLGAETMPLQCVVQVSGAALSMSARDLRDATRSGTALHAILQRYAQYQFDQAAQSTACNWLHDVENRCARWLLMTHDRAQRDEFDLTHQYLATMLGTRRAGVSEVAESLRLAGLISYRRGKMTIVDRAGLERVACECYRSDREDYERLLSRDLRPLTVGDNGHRHS